MTLSHEAYTVNWIDTFRIELKVRRQPWLFEAARPCFMGSSIDESTRVPSTSSTSYQPIKRNSHRAGLTMN